MKTSEQRCPICEAFMAVGIETVKQGDSGWFSGTYVCHQHGLMRISGTVDKSGNRSTLIYIPECSTHGLAPVVPVEPGVCRCLACDQNVTVQATDDESFPHPALLAAIPREEVSTLGMAS